MHAEAKMTDTIAIFFSMTVARASCVPSATEKF
jgi:hypothetical protein